MYMHGQSHLPDVRLQKLNNWFLVQRDKKTRQETKLLVQYFGVLVNGETKRNEMEATSTNLQVIHTSTLQHGPFLVLWLTPSLGGVSEVRLMLSSVYFLLW